MIIESLPKPDVASIANIGTGESLCRDWRMGGGGWVWSDSTLWVGYIRVSIRKLSFRYLGFLTIMSILVTLQYLKVQNKILSEKVLFGVN